MSAGVPVLGCRSGPHLAVPGMGAAPVGLELGGANGSGVGAAAAMVRCGVLRGTIGDGEALEDYVAAGLRAWARRIVGDSGAAGMLHLRVEASTDGRGVATMDVRLHSTELRFWNVGSLAAGLASAGGEALAGEFLNAAESGLPGIWGPSAAKSHRESETEREIDEACDEEDGGIGEVAEATEARIRAAMAAQEAGDPLMRASEADYAKASRRVRAARRRALRAALSPGRWAALEDVARRGHRFWSLLHGLNGMDGVTAEAGDEPSWIMSGGGGDLVEQAFHNRWNDWGRDEYDMPALTLRDVPTGDGALVARAFGVAAASLALHAAVERLRRGTHEAERGEREGWAMPEQEVGTEFEGPEEHALRLTGALLIYEGGGDRRGADGTLCVLHGVAEAGDGRPELGAGRAPTVAFAEDLARRMIGRAPARMIGPDVVGTGASMEAWWVPAGPRTLILRTGVPEVDALSGREFRCPPLLFRAQDARLWVRALLADRRPEPGDAVAAAPFPNVAGSSGSVCLGDVRPPAGAAAASCREWEGCFFGSAFSHAHGALATSHPGGMAGLLLEWGASGRMPDGSLQALRQTVRGFVEGTGA